ncbi:site-specific integrase [Parvicella tangerina]|uniref:Tyrosine recombinase XerC n=1 Tax=Parvicella tangerina TaxID=2829795 RepID=A0A916JMP9_9FLAO|nr:site-specific integrase [Parvicella tangerina]CAG5082231.1 Tyrosine recombinase XerC [Parvicella tangerina]
MAKVKLKLDTRKNREKSDGTYPIVIAISHKGQTRFINLKKSCLIEKWSDVSFIGKSVPNSNLINAKIELQLSKAKTYVLNNTLEVEEMQIGELKSNLEIVVFSSENTTQRTKNRILAKKLNSSSLTKYANERIKLLTQSKGNGYAAVFRSSLERFQSYFGKDEILFADVDLAFLRGFEAYCKSRNNKNSTISIYLRPIQTLYKEAILEGVITSDLNPFERYKIPKAEKTKKRALRIEVIRDIRKLELKPHSALWDAKNYFLFMFNNMGINFVDIAKLEKWQILGAKYENGKLVQGRLNYKRSKSKGEFSIKLTDESLAILNSYNIFEKDKNDKVFPIGYTDTEIGYRTYKQKRKRINRRIREIGAMVGLDEDITTYYARHSWATIAKRKMLPISVISEGLGHSDLRTTQIYLDSFDDDVLDDANDQIVD